MTYALIRSHRRFETLASFTLKSAVEEIRRIRSERKSTPTSATAETEPLNSGEATRPELKATLSSLSLLSIGEEKFSDDADPVRMSEKARGKMREREASLGDESEIGDPGAPGPYRSRSGFTPTEACAFLLQVLTRAEVA